MLVAEAVPTGARRALELKTTRLLAGASKFVPVMATAVPGVPITGERLVIVGAPGFPTVSDSSLVALPPGAVTAIRPVVAPAGIVTTSRVGDDEMIVAVIPFKVTVLSPAVALKAVPEFVMVDQLGPLDGMKSMIETIAALRRAMDRRFPTPS